MSRDPKHYKLPEQLILNIKISNKSLLFLSLLLILTSCSVWRNFNSYFNTYFNAQKFFGEVEEAIQEGTVDRFDFKADNGAKAQTQNIQKVIEKCSAILQDHRESAYFDNSLLMIGKAFYYQQEFIKARRKFNELSVILDSDLLLENKLWLGKTELHLRNFDEGMDILNEVRDSAKIDDNDEIIVDAAVTQIAFLIYRENYYRAIEYSESLLEETDDDELKAEIYFQMGKLYTLLEEPENASEAFAKVPQYEPTYEIEFNSKFENAKLLKQLDRLDESLAVLEELRDEDKNQDNFDVIDLEKGLIWYEQGKVDTAYNQFYDVDTTYKRGEAAGRAEYMLGVIWESDYRDFDSAKFFYGKSVRAAMAPEYKAQAGRKKNLFDKYSTLSGNIYRNSMQYLYATDSSAFIRDSLTYEAYLNRDTTEFDLTEDDPNAEPEVIPTKPSKPRLEADSLNNLLAKTKFELGNLFLTELNIPDSAMKYYNDIKEKHGAKYFEPRLVYSIGTYYLTVGDQEKADSIYNYVYENYYYDEVANEAAKKLGKELISKGKDKAEVKYMEAEDFFLDGEFTKALVNFDSVYTVYPESQYAPRALFTKGYILENKLDMPDSAFSVYDTLSNNYKNSVYTKSVKKKYDFYRAEQKRIADSIAAAQKHIADSLAAIVRQQEIADSLAALPQDSLAVDSVAVLKDSTLITPDSLDQQNNLNNNSVTDTTSSKQK